MDTFSFQPSIELKRSELFLCDKKNNSKILLQMRKNKNKIFKNIQKNFVIFSFNIS